MARHSARSVVVIVSLVSPVNRRPGLSFSSYYYWYASRNGKWPYARKRLNLETENRCVILTVNRITVAEWVARFV